MTQTKLQQMSLPATRTTTLPTPAALSIMSLPKIPTRSANKIKLSPDFVPGRFTVICGRGKLCSSSPGNVYLRKLIHIHLSDYSQAENKTEKSAVVSMIISKIHEVSPNGSFVKQEDDGQWWEVDDSYAREKIGCIFRDILHTQYRSSTKAKHARKKAHETNQKKKKQHHQGKKLLELGNATIITGKPSNAHRGGEGGCVTATHRQSQQPRRQDIDKLIFNHNSSSFFPPEERVRTMAPCVTPSSSSNTVGIVPSTTRSAQAPLLMTNNKYYSNYHQQENAFPIVGCHHHHQHLLQVSPVVEKSSIIERLRQRHTLKDDKNSLFINKNTTTLSSERGDSDDLLLEIEEYHRSSTAQYSSIFSCPPPNSAISNIIPSHAGAPSAVLMPNHQQECYSSSSINTQNMIYPTIPYSSIGYFTNNPSAGASPVSSEESSGDPTKIDIVNQCTNYNGGVFACKETFLLSSKSSTNNNDFNDNNKPTTTTIPSLLREACDIVLGKEQKCHNNEVGHDEEGGFDDEEDEEIDLPDDLSEIFEDV